MEAAASPGSPSRNAACACGSGKRYKHCCGAALASGVEQSGIGSSSTAAHVGTAMGLALDAQVRGDLALASDRYRQVLVVQPDNVDALHMLGVIHFMQGELDEAERLIRYADSLCPQPVQIIQHNLMMLREKIAVSGRPAERVWAIELEGAGSPIARVEIVHDAQEIILPALSFEGASDSPGLRGTLEQTAVFPSIKSFVLENAVVDSESAIPATSTNVMLDTHVDLARHESPEWRYGLYRRAGADDVERTIGVDDFKHATLQSAIVLTSGYWINWAHFLTEVLPKALIADQRPEWRGWPMVISSAALANAQELLRLLVADDREIIKACGRMVIGKAGFVSSVGFCPLEYTYDRQTELPSIRATDCVFSPYALNLVRTASRRLIPPGASAAPLSLYVRRTSSNRRFTNQDEVEEVFRARGFEIVLPETLSVQEQISLFSRAKLIAGPTGAAIANMIFAPPGCQVLVLAAFNRHWPFHYWLNMADAAGHCLQYLFGQATGGSPHPAHPDLYFDDVARLGPIIDTAISESGSP
jgi:capsular polysaccharide biosynthesis protein